MSIYPHTHYLGKDIQLFAELPDGGIQWLLRIPDWDFNWQGDYRYKEPLLLPAGSTIRMHYRFDNSADNPRNPTIPPVDVYGGWRSQDEMAEAMIQVMPVDPNDLETLKLAQKSYDVELAGGEARFHYFSGIYLERQNETARAAEAYKRALTIDPTFASAYVKLAELAESQGNFDQAEALYEEAVAYQPHLIPARLGIAKVMMQKSQLRQAGFILEDVYSENPENLQACLFLARYHLTRRETEEALKIYAEGEDRFRGSSSFHFDYGMALLGTDAAKAEKQFLLAVEDPPEMLDSGSVKPLRRIQSEAAYQLARLCLDQNRIEDGKKYLDFSLNRNPDHLDALLSRANLLLKSGNSKEALLDLITLVDRPENQSFSPRDILANLPFPKSVSTLLKAYQQSGKVKEADNAAKLALEMATTPEDRSHIRS
ncbi:MAG: tetratricopeptide repeat protein, partial [Verrucomicrobiae bacterium]|nr:tetratricopeptide repeat protein [Verrucomicrobiae bacterium]